MATETLTRPEQYLQCAELIQLAQNLAAAKRADDYPAFRDLCLTGGMSSIARFKTDINGPDEEAEESQFYWERLDPTVSGTVETAKSNRGLARALGIELRNDHTAAASLLYRITECGFPDLFDAELTHRPHVSAQESRKLRLPARVTLYHPANGRPKASWQSHLFLLYQGVSPGEIIHRHIRERSAHLYDLMGDDGYRLAQLMHDLRMLIPDQTMGQLLHSVLQCGRNGETIHILGAFCPDYAYEATGDPGLPYRYTFDGLNTGVGLVAQQFARVTRPLSQFFTSLGIKHQFVYGIGDFEADSGDILTRVGCDYPEFVRRCTLSLEAFRQKMGDDLPLTLELCDAHRCKGRLRPYAQAATERMLNGDFGRIGEVFPNPEKVVAQIVRENGGFYRRWFSPDMSDNKIRELVLLQGGEYAALAQIYAEDFKEKNIIVLSGDRPLMHTFDALNTVTPILCVKRAY